MSTGRAGVGITIPVPIPVTLNILRPRLRLANRDFFSSHFLLIPGLNEDFQPRTGWVPGPARGKNE